MEVEVRQQDLRWTEYWGVRERKERIRMIPTLSNPEQLADGWCLSLREKDWGRAGARELRVLLRTR